VADDINKTRLIVQLLEGAQAQESVRAFLKKKAIASSGNWKELLDKRIIPAIQDSAISNSELLEVLASVEEHGRQHVFLFQCAPDVAAELMDRETIKRSLELKGLARLLTEPDAVGLPDHPSIVDVRWESAAIDLSLTIKVVQSREFLRPISSDSQGRYVTKTWEKVQQRAVCVAKLHHHGLLEIRIASHTNSTRYEKDVQQFWRHIIDLIPVVPFEPYALTVAKERIFVEREALAGIIRYSVAALRDKYGHTVIASANNEDGDLATGKALSNGLDAILHEDGQCDEMNIVFVAAGEIKRDLRVAIGRELNEIALRANFEQVEHKHVLDQLRILNAPKPA